MRLSQRFSQRFSLWLSRWTDPLPGFRYPATRRDVIERFVLFCFGALIFIDAAVVGIGLLLTDPEGLLQPRSFVLPAGGLAALFGAGASRRGRDPEERRHNVRVQLWSVVPISLGMTYLTVWLVVHTSV